MKTISKKFSFIVVMLIAALIFGISIVAAQNGNGNNSPPNGQKGSQNQNQQQNQEQNQNQQQNQNQTQNQNHDCMNACEGTQNQNHEQNQEQNQNHEQNQEQNQNQDCINGCDGAQTQNQNQVNDCPNCKLSQVGDLPDDLVTAMNAGLMDEYTAYEVYAAIMAQFGEIAPFSKIQKAEAQHIRVWEYLFVKYGLELPVQTGVDVPVFDSPVDACAYALDLEIANAALYEDMLTTVADYRNITNIVKALQSASLNQHLPALEQCVAQ